MTEEKTVSRRLAKLRKRAEAMMKQEIMDIPNLSTEEVAKLIHELRTHEIELEMQNEELRRAQDELIDSRDRYSELYDFSPVGYVTINSKGFIQEANLTLAEMLNMGRSALLKQALSAVIVPEDQDIFYRHRRAILESKQRETCRLRMRRINAEPIWVELESILADSEGDIGSRLQTAVIDVTDRMRAEEEIKKALAEKTVLLKELHHRVKNNMQVVQSLLGLQARETESREVKNALLDCRDRAQSMALTHELLYHSKNFASLDVNAFVGDLIENLFRSHHADPERIELYLDVAPISLGLDQAIPFGLVLNELITNTLKYAFPGDQRGRIEVHLSSPAQGECRVVFRDNGVGISEEVDIAGGGTLGLKLIKEIVERQLGGRIELNRSQGTQFIIDFNLGPNGG